MKTAREEHKENCRNNAVSLEKAWNCIQKKNASRSAKPGQAHIPASPCPADTNTPSRHPGAIDREVNEDTRAVKKLCDCQFHLHPCQTIGRSAITNPD